MNNTREIMRRQCLILAGLDPDARDQFETEALERAHRVEVVQAEIERARIAAVHGDYIINQ